MSTDPRILDLLLRWEEAKKKGRLVPAEDLCRDCPELLDEVKRRIEALQSLDEKLGTPDTDSEDAGSVVSVHKPASQAHFPRSADRNLLFGILALQMDFISRDALIVCMHAWVLNKEKPLAQILVDQKALSLDRRAMLEPLVEEHVKQHGNDPEQSLAAISSISSLRQDLWQIPDQDLQATLTHTSSMEASALDPDGRGREISTGTRSSAPARFRIIRPHAHGGLGEVFVARDEELHREVALKQLQDRHADDPRSRARFLLEAQVTGGLEHPGVVPVYGLGQYSDGRPFYAMRFVKGDSLKDAIERYHRGNARGDSGERTLAFRKLLGRFVDVCNAVAYAHSRGVLHRDLKPGNIMLGKYGETLVVDWGLAKPAGKTPAAPDFDEATLRPPQAGASEPTQIGSAVGTPAYMSPEQAAGQWDKVGPASDVYSLGATLYTLLTGQAPFKESDLPLLISKVQLGEFVHPRQMNADTPAALEAICLKAMALLPADRYASPRDMADDVERWLADEPVVSYAEPFTARMRRWGRRHRALVMGAMAAIVVAATSSTVAAIYLKAANERERQARLQEALARNEETLARQRAEEQRREAEQQRERAERLTYASQIALAQREWQGGNPEQALRPLDSCRRDLRGWEHNYLYTLCTRNRRILHSPTKAAPFTSVAFGPDGNRLVSGSGDNILEVWDVATGREMLALKGHSDMVISVAFSADGRRLVSGSKDRSLRVWDAQSGQEILTLKGHSEAVSSVTFSPDGKRLASGSWDNTMKVWDAQNGQEILTLRGHSKPVTSVAFSPDGKRLVSGSSDKTLKVWNAQSGQEILTLKGHSKAVTSVAFSPDSERLVSGSLDNTLKVWTGESGKELLTLKGHSDHVTSVAFSPDSQRLASGSADQTVKIWDALSGREMLTLTGHRNDVSNVAFSPDGKRLASGSWDGTIRVSDAQNGPETLTLKGHTEPISSVAFSPDSKRVASGSTDNSVKIWNAESGLEILTLKGHILDVYSVTFSPDGKRLASGSRDKTVKIWDVKSGRETLTLQGHSGVVSSVAFSPDGKRLASASEDGSVKVWDAQNGQGLLTIIEGQRVRQVAFSPDGKRLASCSNRSFKVWDAQTGQEALTLPEQTMWPVLSLAFSPDGKRLVGGGVFDMSVKIWDAQSGQKMLTLLGHARPVNSVTFSPDGKRLASGSSDNTVKVWDAESGHEMLTLKDHVGPVGCVAFSPDGKRLVSGSFDQTVKVWDASDSEPPPGNAGPTNPPSAKHKAAKTP
jgi:WD40 repeat protein/serine/threonine protein kinase